MEGVQNEASDPITLTKVVSFGKLVSNISLPGPVTFGR